MYEDRPEKDTPEWIQEELREYGGSSPSGKAIWRLVLAQNCRIRCFGSLNYISQDIEKLQDDVEFNDDQEAAVRETRLLAPDRIEVGEHWIPRYDVEGWILQRWFPASAWGTREKWEGERDKDGRTKLLAAYPQSGDYMVMPCGPWRTIAEVGDLKAAIRCYNVQQRRNPVNFGNHMKALLAFEEQTRRDKTDAYAEEISAQHRLALAGTLRSVSTSAQRFRNVVAKHTVGGVNLGASEKWG